MKKCGNEKCNAINSNDSNFHGIRGRRLDDSGSGITGNPNRSSPEPTKIVRGIKFVLIKGGTFTTGSPESEPEHKNNETQHKVTVSDFYTADKTVGNEHLILNNTN